MSKSELHDWECNIEELSGNNADKMLEIAQDIYNTAFVRGKNHMTWEQPRWIPVGEKLPKEDDEYLVTVFIGTEIDTNKPVKEVSKDCFYLSHGWSYYGEHVIAWQPLPTPYKEESEEYND